MTFATYAVWITLWPLSGFLAAWLSHYMANEYYPQHTSVEDVLAMTVCGGLTWLVFIFCIVRESYILKQPFFKAKEPK